MELEDIVRNVHALVLDNVPTATRTPSGWYTLNCVMCSDTRHRAGILLQGSSITYNCFNCGFSSGWRPGLPLGRKYRNLCDAVGTDQNAIKQCVFDLLKYQQQLSELSELNFGAASATLGKFKSIRIPGSISRISDVADSHPIRQYAQQRGILGTYPLFMSDDSDLQNRLIIPFTYAGELVGYTARHTAITKKTTPKYISEQPSGYVFNVDAYFHSGRRIVIVTEGVMDAILVSGVSTLGNSVNSAQAHQISQLADRVILCPDRDQDGRQLIEQAVALDWCVSFPEWHPDVKDAADACARYGRALTVQSILNAATDNKIKIGVNSKLKKNLAEKDY